MLARAYCRCNSGHYFVGEYCPFDGWSSSASKELAAVSERLARLVLLCDFSLMIHHPGVSAAAGGVGTCRWPGASDRCAPLHYAAAHG